MQEYNDGKARSLVYNLIKKQLGKVIDVEGLNKKMVYLKGEKKRICF